MMKMGSEYLCCAMAYSHIGHSIRIAQPTHRIQCPSRTTQHPRGLRLSTGSHGLLYTFGPTSVAPEYRNRWRFLIQAMSVWGSRVHRAEPTSDTTSSLLRRPMTLPERKLWTGASPYFALSSLGQLGTGIATSSDAR